MDVSKHDSSTSTRQTMTNVCVCVQDEERGMETFHMLTAGFSPSSLLTGREVVVVKRAGTGLSQRLSS